jgi:hypothetical protein
VSGLQIIGLPKSLNNGVNMMRVNFDSASMPSGLLRRNQRGAASGKRVENDPAAIRAVQDGVGHQP